MPPCFSDTNILLRLSNPADPEHLVVRQAVDKLLDDRTPLHFAPQNGREFWNASTRPLDKNGRGLSVEEAERQLRALEVTFTVLPDKEETYRVWQEIVNRHQVLGAKVHDAFLVASMLCHGITHILTLNIKDFARYADLGIVVVDPNDV